MQDHCFLCEYQACVVSVIVFQGGFLGLTIYEYQGIQASCVAVVGSIKRHGGTFKVAAFAELRGACSKVSERYWGPLNYVEVQCKALMHIELQV